MASIVPEGKKFRAHVFKRGIRETKLFLNKSEAKAWASARELAIERGASPRSGTGKSLHDAIDRFVREECPKRKGERWEIVRLSRIKREMPDKPLRKVTADDIAVWRNSRLATVTGPTVRREMTLLKTVLETARRDWGWVEVNPMADVKRPSPGKARTRIFSQAEVDAVLAACSYIEGAEPVNVGQRMCIALLIALETGMRAGEIGKAIVSGKVANIPETKNGDSREVPLSRRAQTLFAAYRPLTATQIDSAFRLAKKKAGLTDLHFHDSRATACTRLAKIPGIGILELSRIIGHRDPRSLMIYFRESAESLADRLG